MSILSDGLARYLSPEHLLRLQSVHVGIAGAGGLGSNVASMLVRSGIRRLTIIDYDSVDASNLNRQAYLPEDVGMPKVEALARLLKRIEPELDITPLHAMLLPDNTAGYFQHCGIVVEALDSADIKAMCFTALRHAPCYYIGASGLAGWGGPAMELRRIGPNAVCVGDFVSQVGDAGPPMAPRVTQAAAMQADAVLQYILGDVSAN